MSETETIIKGMAELIIKLKAKDNDTERFLEEYIQPEVLIQSQADRIIELEEENESLEAECEDLKTTIAELEEEAANS